MLIHAVLLDIDGTLVDSNEFHAVAWQRAFAASHITQPLDAIRKQIGKGADMLIPALVPGLSQEQRDPIAKCHGEIFKAEFLAKVEPFPCAYELIETLHRSGREIVLASSADQREVDHYIELLDIHELLTATTSADDVKNSKPAGDIFASALKKTRSARPSECIVIGDTPFDVIAAAKCRIRTIALRSGGFSDAELVRARPVAIYADIADLFVNLPASLFADDE